MPFWEIIEEQTEEYKKHILSGNIITRLMLRLPHLSHLRK
jgi:hypothetical protein